MQRKITFVFLTQLFITCCLSAGLLASSSQTGTTTANFLKIGAGARPTGMGGAFAAVSDDVNAVYWNPAGLVQLKEKEFGAVHTLWLEGISHDYLAFASPIGEKNFAYGFNVIYFGTGDIDRRTATGASDGKARTSDYSVAGSLGWKVTENISLGATLKGIRMGLDKDKKTGFAADVAILDKLPGNISLGVMGQNIGPSITIANTSEDLPMNLKAGLAYGMLENRFIISGDVDMPNDRDPKLHLGAEYRFNKLFAMRAGYEDVNSPGDSSGLSAGLSVNEDSLDEILNVNLQFDYAWMYFGDLGSTHRIAIGVKF